MKKIFIIAFLLISFNAYSYDSNLLVNKGCSIVNSYSEKKAEFVVNKIRELVLTKNIDTKPYYPIIASIYDCAYERFNTLRETRLDREKEIQQLEIIEDENEVVIKDEWLFHIDKVEERCYASNGKYKFFPTFSYIFTNPDWDSKTNIINYDIERSQQIVSYRKRDSKKYYKSCNEALIDAYPGENNTNVLNFTSNITVNDINY